MERRRCPRCGNPYEEGDRFCRICGAQLEGENVALTALISEYERKLADNPDDPNLRYNLALAYKHMGFLEPARRELEKVIALSPDFPEAFLDLVEVLLGMGEREEARRIWREASQKFPDNERLTELGKLVEGD